MCNNGGNIPTGDSNSSRSSNNTSHNGGSSSVRNSGNMSNNNKSRLYNGTAVNGNDDNVDDIEDNASSDMNEVDFEDGGGLEKRRGAGGGGASSSVGAGSVDLDKNGEADSSSMQGSPMSVTTVADKDNPTGEEEEEEPAPRKKKKTKQLSKSASMKLTVDRKKLAQYIGEGEVLVPVPRARRRVRGGDLGYMVKRGHAVVRYIDKDGVVYNPSETAYLKNKEKGKPYFVCAIDRFNLTKRDTLMVVIKWFFRLSEVPGSVYHHLTLDRELHRKNGEDIVCDSSIQQRELFSSDATDTYPITSLRGRCHVVQYTDLKSACSCFVPRPDHFFYILAYRPDNRRLATTQGEIRVGPSHQARLPECRPGTNPNDMPEKCETREEIRWRPNKVVDGDLLMYLRAARSIAAFAGMCGGTAEDRCEAESMDETTVNALDTLHKHNYDTSKSMQALVKGPSVMYIERKWSEEDMKRFAKGVRNLGKNFFKIRKEHLPHKDTSELVEFYYFWKKSPAANNSRPNYRCRHRRQLKRQSPRTSQPDNCEASSGSESGGEESEESDGSRDVTTICQVCYTTSSRDWHNTGKDGGVLCSKCHTGYKKYGEDPSTTTTNNNLESPSPTSPYHFRPVTQEEDSAPPSKHNMRTRRSNNTASTNGKKKERAASPEADTITSSNTGANRSDRNNTNDKDNDDKKSKDSTSKSKKRRFDTEEDSSRKKKKERSDSESGSESGSVSGPEGLGNDRESDINNQEDLSDSSRPSSPTSSIEPSRPQATLSDTTTNTTPSLVASTNPSVLSKDNSVLPLTNNNPHIEGAVSAIAGSSNSQSSKLTSNQSALSSSNNPHQQQPTNPFTNPAISSSANGAGLTPAGLTRPPLAGQPPPLSSSIPSTTAPSNSLPTGIPSSSSHLRSLQQPPSHHHPQNPNQFIRPPIGIPGPAGITGHISSIGTITNASGNVQHPIGSISANNSSVACNFSPLVIPSPALSRASSTGTFIPRTELAVPSLSSNSSSSGTDSIANSSSKANSQSSSSSTTDSVQRIPPSGVSNSNNSGNNNPNNPFSRMQQQPEQQSSSASNDDQDKKPPIPQPSSSSSSSSSSTLPPHPAGVPPHLPPGTFLPGAHPGAVPYPPFHHYYYPQHPGAPHLPPHLAALHPAAAAAAAAAAGAPPPPPSSSSSSTSTSSTGPNPLSTAPPPVPSLVPIKKEVHSPPPPLKSSTDNKPSDILSSSSSPSSSALHALHRSLPPPPDGATMGKLPPGFPPTGLPSTAPLPPPPLTVIDHRDNSGQNKPHSEDNPLSKSINDHYPKDHPSSSNSNIRGLNPSPHRPEGVLPPPHSSLLHQSRMDNNLSILSESREIGLKGGINPSSHPSSSSSSHPAIKEEPNNPPHHSISPSAAAFQPYPHHHHPHPHLAPNPHHPGLPPPSSSQLPPPPHGSSTASLPPSSSSSSSSSSVLQVPQPPHQSSTDHHHPPHHHGGIPPSHHMDSSLHNGGSGRPSDLINNIKKEPTAPVEEIHVEDDDDEPMGGSTTPGPPPTACNREFYKSHSAIFVKVYDRGERNQCSRTDFHFKPLPGSNLAKKREERIRKASHSSSSAAREEKKRVETPPRATSASENQKSSGGGGGCGSGAGNSGHNPSASSTSSHPGHGPPTPYQDRHTPRQFTDTPALRQLHEYARPHVLNSDPRAVPYSLAGLPHHPHMDPLLSYRISMYPPGSRERLELELERDKRERDAREREMRERELREMELRDKMDLKPGLERLLPPGAGQVADAASWIDLQRRMGFLPAGAGPLIPHGHSAGAVGSHVPGVYPPTSLANDLLAREREKLDRFGLAANLPQLADMSYASAVERLSQERQAAERQAAERERDRERLAALAANDPSARLQLASAAAATQHAHTHTHAHSHTHLHLHQQEVAAHAQAVAQAQAHGLTPPAFPLGLAAGGHGPPIYPPHHPLAATNPGAADAIVAAGGGPNAASALPPSSSANPLPVLPPGVMHHPLLAGISNREELLQREIYSRSGHFIDPALAHQLSAQAAAHEALQRQIAMERERFGSSSHLPH